MTFCIAFMSLIFLQVQGMQHRLRTFVRGHIGRGRIDIAPYFLVYRECGKRYCKTGARDLKRFSVLSWQRSEAGGEKKDFHCLWLPIYPPPPANKQFLHHWWFNPLMFTWICAFMNEKDMVKETGKNTEIVEIINGLSMRFWCLEQKMLINIHPSKNVFTIYQWNYAVSFLNVSMYRTIFISYITKRDFCYSFLINFLGIMFLALK